MLVQPSTGLCIVSTCGTIARLSSHSGFAMTTFCFIRLFRSSDQYRKEYRFACGIDFFTQLSLQKGRLSAILPMQCNSAII